MKAILLAAGVGRRLDSFTHDRPKCLLAMGRQHLLGRTLEALSSVGVEETVIVVGHCADQVRRAGGESWGEMRLRYVHNPDFEEGSIVSLWCAREALVQDALVMDADVLFPTVMLQRLVEAAPESCALLDGRVQGRGEEMILFAARGRVWDIVRRRPNEMPEPPPGVDSYDALGESVGFLKVGAAHVGVLLEILEARLAAGARASEHEQVYPTFFSRCPVGYEGVDDLPWTEVDFEEDVARARKEILPQIERLAAARS